MEMRLMDMDKEEEDNDREIQQDCGDNIYKRDGSNDFDSDRTRLW